MQRRCLLKIQRKWKRSQSTLYFSCHTRVQIKEKFLHWKLSARRKKKPNSDRVRVVHSLQSLARKEQKKVDDAADRKSIEDINFKMTFWYTWKSSLLPVIRPRLCTVHNFSSEFSTRSQSDCCVENHFCVCSVDDDDATAERGENEGKTVKIHSIRLFSSVGSFQLSFELLTPGSVHLCCCS